MQDLTPQIATALKQQWDLKVTNTMSEEELLRLLALRVSALLERDPEAFFQLMYRLDISEKKLQDVMYGDGDRPLVIAQLIYQRQLQKIQSRLEHGTGNASDADLRW